MKVKGPKIAATSEERNVPRCAKYYTSVQKLKSIELDAIGDGHVIGGIDLCGVRRGAARPWKNE